MIEAVRGYLRSVVTVSLFAGILLSLTPKGPVRRTLRFLCGLLLLLTALGPLARLDPARIAGELSRMRLETGQAVREIENSGKDLTAALIKERAEAYIWDKAAALGISLAHVTVTLDREGEYPCPSAVKIAASCTAAQKEQLSSLLARDLAIGPERQEWVSNE